MKNAAILFATLLIFQCKLNAQVEKPASWTFSVREVSAELVDLQFKATINSPWHMYGLNIPEGGPIPASIQFNQTGGFVVEGKTTQSPKPEIIDDKIFEMKLELHSHAVTFTQRIRKKTSDSLVITGVVEYMTCSDMQCVLGEADFIFRLNGLPVSSENLPSVESGGDVPASNAADTQQSAGNAAYRVPLTTAENTDGKPARNGSLLGVFLIAMLAGLGGLLTPCVYPMIPMTVSYFLRGNKSRSRAISEALVFGISIVLLYTLIGIAVAIFKNPNAVNNFTTHWLTNAVFFTLFLVLSASFFGMFEIMLPAGLANRVDKQADRGGYVGAFFMALAMAILSFSCTGPIVASLLIKASQGNVLEPVVGMAGFSIVFALPFTLFAIFPSWLQTLPKSGSWLNAVKVFFAFVMLAFSLYFLAKIDQSYHLNLISRNLFLSVWVVVFALLGFYLLGLFRFAHDSDSSATGVPRFFFSVAVLSFAVYLFTGLLGSPLHSLSSILPPPEKQTDRSTVSQQDAAITSSSKLCGTPKYASFLELPHGLEGYFDYEEALACAREMNKPVLVDFVGHTCSNCKKMYAEVWSDPQVLELLRNEFIVVALYTDDKTKLPESEWITSTVDAKVKNTMGRKNQDFQITRFGSNALPLYAVVNGEGEELVSERYAYNPNPQAFAEWLKSALAESSDK